MQEIATNAVAHRPELRFTFLLFPYSITALASHQLDVLRRHQGNDRQSLAFVVREVPG